MMRSHQSGEDEVVAEPVPETFQAVVVVVML
jgi:hypothetical protein